MAWPLLAVLASCASTDQAEATGPVVARRLEAPLVVTDMDGVTHDLDRVLASGERVALVFWSTWCSSCLAEAPHLASAAAEWEGDIRFIGVVPGPDESVDDQRVLEVAEDYAIPYPQVRDRDLALTKRFGVTGTPTIFVLGEGGAWLYEGHEPPADWGALTSTR